MRAPAPGFSPTSARSRPETPTSRPASRWIRSRPTSSASRRSSPRSSSSMESSESAGTCDQGFSCAYTNTISWRSATTPLPMENDPRAVFERLFGDAGSTDAAARLVRMRQQRSILDSVTREVRRPPPRARADDRGKLDRVPRRGARRRAAHPDTPKRRATGTAGGGASGRHPRHVR